MLHTVCPGCGKKLNAPDSAAGKRARCPKCKTVVTLPSAPDEIADADDLLEEVDAPAPPPQPARASASAARRPIPAAPPPAEDEYGLSDDVPLAPPPLPPSAPPLPRAPTAVPPVLTPRKMSVATDADDDLSTLDWVVAILCSTIGCIVGIVYMVQGKPKGKKMFLISLAVNVIAGAVQKAVLTALHHQ